jgi:hypothetical protein
LFEELKSAREMFDCDKALDILMRAVDEYRHAAAIHDLVWQPRPIGETARGARLAAHASR